MAAPTEEYHSSFASVQHSNQVLRVLVVVTLIIVAVVAMASFVWVSHEAAQIRQTQLHNTQVAACQDKAFNDILKDVRLAFAENKNPADYLRAPAKC